MSQSVGPSDSVEQEVLTQLDRVWFLNLAQTSAVLMKRLPDVNWVGFYLMHDGELVLGPFQGQPACLRISLDRGVCGKAAREQKTIRVDDVDKFPGHITCDAASLSEVVVPLILNGRLLGVLDVDSPKHSRFTADDQALLERVTKILIENTDWPAAF